LKRIYLQIQNSLKKISVQLNETIHKRKTNSISHAKFVKKVDDLVKDIKDPSRLGHYPKSIDTGAKMAFYDNLIENKEVVLKIHQAIIKNKPDGWKGHEIKEKRVEIAIKKTLKKLGIDDKKLIKDALKLAIEQKEY